MRAFIVLCLIASAFAAPQGYNYNQQQQQQQQSGFQFGSSSTHSSSSSNSIGQEGQSFLQEALQNAKVQQTLLNGGAQNSYRSAQNYYQRPQQQQQSFGSIFSAQPNFGQQQQQQQQRFQPQQYQQSYNHHTPTVTKDIYVHVAPEEQEEKYAPAPVQVAPPRKHYRIVFIKAPTPSVNTAALRVKQAPTEEKTIIYVLTKKPDPLDLEAAFQDVAPKQPSKPEVYFIKYKTQAEAQHAQRTIQAQYDQLGGTTQVSDEGVAPVSSVIGALDHQQGSTGNGGFTSSGSGIGISTGSGSSKYLPPIVKH